MTNLEHGTLERRFSAAAEDVLVRAVQDAPMLGYIRCDPGHVLHQLAALGEDYSVHRPLKQLGLNPGRIQEILKFYPQSPQFNQINYQLLHTEAHFEVMMAKSEVSALSRGEGSMITIGDLAVGALATHSPLVRNILLDRHIKYYEAMAALGAPASLVVPTLDVTV